METADEEAVSIRAVADAVGVTPPAIYLHFADKRELILEVCAASFAELDRVSEEAAAGSSDPVESLRLRGRAYVQFEERAGQVKSPRGAKTELVLQAIRALPGEFRLADLERACPGVGRDWIRAILADLRQKGDLSCQGRGPAARWKRMRNEGSISK